MFGVKWDGDKKVLLRVVLQLVAKCTNVIAIRCLHSKKPKKNLDVICN